MSRVNCPHCGKQFKNQSGLAYHLGWAHKPCQEDDQIADDQPAEDGFLAELFGDDDHSGWAHNDPDPEITRALQKSTDSDDFFEYLLGGKVRDCGDLAELTQQLLSSEDQAELLRQIQEEIKRLQVHSDENHLTETIDDCTECREMLEHIARRCAVEVARAIFSIPGVREANAFNDWARARNADVVNWYNVPGVKEVVKRYQDGLTTEREATDILCELGLVDP